MLTLHRHRATILLASLALLLSTVGLPVVVMACEMGTVVLTKGCGGSCKRAQPASGERITRIPCQATCRFIGGNTTAYVPAKRAETHQPFQILAILFKVPDFSAVLSPFSCGRSERPPRTHDIPILTSSLLI